MLNRHSSKEGPARARSHRWLMLVLVGSLIPALGGAQAPSEPRITVLKSGLQTLLARHSFVLTLTDVGPQEAASWVTIEFRDRAGQRRAFTSARLSPDRPARLRASIASGAVSDQWRVVVTIEPIDGAASSEPIVGLEDLDADSLVLNTRPPCAPPSGGVVAQGNCDGWVINRLALGQAPH